jgi:DNA-binding NarL/FixJ family response regulator
LTSLLQKRTFRVFLIQRRPLAAEAMRMLLERDPEISVVGVAPEPESADLRRLRPDLVFIDADEIAGDIETAISTCERLSPQTRICVVSSQHRPGAMQRALAAKADAYIAKDTSPAALLELVHLVVNGDSYADPRIAGSMLRRRNARPAEANELSAREHEIARLIADGLSNRDIGKRLTLSEKTVKNHVSHILAKLKVTARSGVAVYAVRNGLVR